MIDTKKSPLLYADLTAELWKAFRKLYAQFEKRQGFDEPAITRALVNELKTRKLCVSTEVPVVHKQNGSPIKLGRMDVVIDCRVVVEVKNVRKLEALHIHQLQRYLEDSGKRVGILLNFGQHGVDLTTPQGRRAVYRRLEYPTQNIYLE
jgi:GxxExxY protein